MARTKRVALYSATKSLQNSCTAKLQLFSSILEAKQQLNSSCSGMQERCAALPDKGTCRGQQLWDAGTCGTGTRDVKYKDVGTSNTGTRGICMIIAKVRVKCDISFFVKMCYLLSTLDSIVQNHIRQLMMFTQNISHDGLRLQKKF